MPNPLVDLVNRATAPVRRRRAPRSSVEDAARAIEEINRALRLDAQDAADGLPPQWSRSIPSAWQGHGDAVPPDWSQVMPTPEGSPEPPGRPGRRVDADLVVRILGGLTVALGLLCAALVYLVASLWSGATRCLP